MWLSPGLPGVILWSGGVAALQAGECQLATSARRVCGGCRPRRRSRQGVCASKAFVRMLRAHTERNRLGSLTTVTFFQNCQLPELSK